MCVFTVSRVLYFFSIHMQRIWIEIRHTSFKHAWGEFVNFSGHLRSECGKQVSFWFSWGWICWFVDWSCGICTTPQSPKKLANTFVHTLVWLVLNPVFCAGRQDLKIPHEWTCVFYTLKTDVGWRSLEDRVIHSSTSPFATVFIWYICSAPTFQTQCR